MKKITVLILALLLPAIGVVIFNFFSQSHFTVSVLYQDEVPSRPGCNDVRAPYSIDSALRFHSNKKPISPFSFDHFKIINFEKPNQALTVELNAIGDTFYGMDVVDIYLVKDADSTNRSEIPISKNIHAVYESATKISELKKCIFLFENEEDDAVLVDGNNRIRGFYNLGKRQEVDSLIIETKILLREKKLRD